MTDLNRQVTEYLERSKYKVLVKRGDLSIFEKLGVGDSKDVWLVYASSEPNPGTENKLLETRITTQFDLSIKNYPNSKRWLVTETRGGLSKKFLNDAKDRQIDISVPIHFFDTMYKHEAQSGSVQTFTKKIIDAKPRSSRIPQPFTLIESGKDDIPGEDLLLTLLNEYKNALAPKNESAKVRVILGPAGIGKTWLFNALFAELYEHFIDRKQAQETFFRPIPLTPEYQKVTDPRVDDIVSTFINTELAQQVAPETLKWLLSEGYSTWLFDGLDELYAGDGAFFDQIDTLIQENGSVNKAQILICARESLSVSSQSFADFLLGSADNDSLQIYRLDSWKKSSKRQFASRHLPDTDVERFITYISQGETLAELSGLPYYCSLLLEEFKRGRQQKYSNDFELMENMISHMIERDVVEKGLLNLTDIKEGDFEDWLGIVAYEFYSKNLKGIPKEEIEEYSEAILKAGLSEEERKKALIALTQFPLFSPALESNSLGFEHELVAEYLTGKYLVNRFIRNPKTLTDLLSTRVDFSESLLSRYLAFRISGLPDGTNKLVHELKAPALPDMAFSNLLNLFLLSAPDSKDIIKVHKIGLETRNLSQINFRLRDLSSYSLNGCDLTNTVFYQCSLKDSDFAGAVLSGTRFEKITNTQLRGAKFGDLAKFDFVYVDNRRINDRSIFNQWIKETSGYAGSIIEPCPTSVQFRTLLLKFIYPDGRLKNSKMKRHALLTGRRHEGAPSPEKVLDESIRRGFFENVNRYDFIRSVPGDKRDDLVSFVTQWELSKGITGLLDELCEIVECQHLPKR